MNLTVLGAMLGARAKTQMTNGLRAIEMKTKGPEAKLFEDLRPSQTTVLQSQTKSTPVNFPILLPG